MSSLLKKFRFRNGLAQIDASSTASALARARDSPAVEKSASEPDRPTVTRGEAAICLETWVES